jgi:hypothetical protein
MKRSKFSYSHIFDEVKCIEAGLGVTDICREMGISARQLITNNKPITVA